jgi:2-polyprenyl-3-methyl-5-hydroxy-6-metoxy-1,4-benzoquinol methylase
MCDGREIFVASKYGFCSLYVAISCYIFQPGGSIFVTTLNRTLVMWAFGIILAEHVLRVVPQGIHDLNKFIKPHETQALLEKRKYNEVYRLYN